MKRFWVVIGEGSNVISGGGYPSEDDAIAAAKRLATDKPQTFWVLKSVGAARRTDPPVVYDVLSERED